MSRLDFVMLMNPKKLQDTENSVKNVCLVLCNKITGTIPCAQAHVFQKPPEVSRPSALSCLSGLPRRCAPASDTAGSRSNRIHGRKQHVTISSAASQQNKHHIDTFSAVLQGDFFCRVARWEPKCAHVPSRATEGRQAQMWMWSHADALGSRSSRYMYASRTSTPSSRSTSPSTIVTRCWCASVCSQTWSRGAR